MANWTETVYGKQDIPSESYTDEYITGKSYTSQVQLPEIPPMFKRDKEAEATAKKADVYVRFMAKP
jgi:hypothetical protein